MRILIGASAAILLSQGAIAQARPAQPADLLALEEVADPQIAPDGDAIVYTVTKANVEEDENVTHVWIAAWDGSGTRQLTGREGESESSPKFSPDGSQIGFISTRADKDEEGQLWLLPRAGGEAQPLVDITGSVDDFAWSPDMKYLALVVTDPEEKLADEKLKDRPQPLVIDRYYFKEDGTGYLGKRRQRVWLYDIAAGKAARLTDGNYNEILPAWSPDSTQVVFTSKRAPDPDRTEDSNLYVAKVASVGAAPRQLTTYTGADNAADNRSHPAWSPDGKLIAYLRGGDPKLIWYAVTDLAVIPAAGGEAKVLTAGLDRNVASPIWSPDSASIQFLTEDDGIRRLDRVNAAGGPITTVMSGEQVLSNQSAATNGRTALLSSTSLTPSDVFVLDGPALRQVSSHNAALLADLDLGAVTRTSFTSKDGTEVHGFIHQPHGAKSGKALPSILYIHGGPTSQFDRGFNLMQHVMAASGYAVISTNPRGSSGRGVAYASAINAAWGSVDVEDVLAGVDDAVAKGIADPARLGIGGWSYGGMLTNYTIASDTRFKAAVSGASIANVTAGYGTDMYTLSYEREMGKPWENLEGYLKISYPFFQNQSIVTPTMFMVGQNDFNVPALNSEQMYQALKSRGIDTRLVIYPGENHGIERPSFVKDRMDRWLAWYDGRVK